jgi:Tautomerase enzyme
MPLVTLTVCKSKPTALKTAVLDAIHTALVSVGVPAADRFQRVIELAPEDFRFDATYPDLEKARTDDFMIIEILWSVGRSVKIKRAMIEALKTGLTNAGLDMENVMLCFKETAWENWSFAGGRMLHV